MHLTDSTRLMHLGSQTGLQAFAETTQLSLADLERSLNNPDSPLHAIYETIALSVQLDTYFHHLFLDIEEKRTALKAKEVTLKEEQTMMPSELTADYNERYSDIHAAFAELDHLETLYRALQDTTQKMQAVYHEHLHTFAEQYSDMKENLRAAFIEGGMTRFSEDDLINTLNYLYQLTEKNDVETPH